MSRTRTIVLVSALGIAGLVVSGVLWYSISRRPITLTGAVLRQDADSGRQAPIADVEVTAENSLALQSVRSDSEGQFHLKLLPQVRAGQPVTLRFQHADYKPLLLTEPAGGRLYIARMAPLSIEAQPATSGPPVNISNVTIRYTLRTSTTENVGTAVKTFQAANIGNVRCARAPACSPNGKWKASIASINLDAGEGNEFRRPRVTCIAGPCPFTRIEKESLAQNGRIFDVSVRAWSDTATFLVQAEVVRNMYEEVVRRVYPVVFGNGLNFTLSADAEGPSIEAEVDGTPIVFPLGPELCLTWADCHVRSEADQSKVYRCQLKPGYQFR